MIILNLGQMNDLKYTKGRGGGGEVNRIKMELECRRKRTHEVKGSGNLDLQFKSKAVQRLCEPLKLVVNNGLR